MDRRAAAAYLLLVARQASTRADLADRAGAARDVGEIARIQDGEEPMGFLARLRAAWAVLRG